MYNSSPFLSFKLPHLVGGKNFVTRREGRLVVFRAELVDEKDGTRHFLWGLCALLPCRPGTLREDDVYLTGTQCTMLDLLYADDSQICLCSPGLFLRRTPMCPTA